LISRGSDRSSTRPASFPLNASTSPSFSILTLVTGPRTGPSVPGVQAFGTATSGAETGLTIRTAAWS
jgi:hypothetical protein